ncbi:MAG: saccharopine dehydrogenase NADP-binding domain-containing protein [Crocinitomicaceae bacterium]|nr:saccharopine dehydrogenase NADP-binding domain-containing protein [Crocinitomicaceae bacterium]
MFCTNWKKPKPNLKLAQKKTDIVLIGAYGYTGKLICNYFQDNQISINIAGRDESKLQEIQKKFSCVSEIIISDISREQECQNLISAHSFFINCAGPFTEESAAFVKLISQAKNKYYLDICGESSFIKKSFEENHIRAIANNTCIIHGCAFESMLADLAVQTLIKQTGKINSLFTYYLFDHSKPSPGTRITMKLSKYRNFQKIENGDWYTYKPSEEIKKIDFSTSEKNTAIPYPLPELVFNYIKYKPKQVMSYLLVSHEESLFFGDAEKPSGDLKAELIQLKKRAFAGPSESDRQKQQCTVYVQVQYENGNSDMLKLTTTDMYKLTANCIYLAVQKMKAGIELKGVLCPGELFKGHEKETLNSLGVKMHLL